MGVGVVGSNCGDEREKSNNLSLKTRELSITCLQWQEVSFYVRRGKCNLQVDSRFWFPEVRKLQHRGTRSSPAESYINCKMFPQIFSTLQVFFRFFFGALQLIQTLARYQKVCTSCSPPVPTPDNCPQKVTVKGHRGSTSLSRLRSTPQYLITSLFNYKSRSYFVTLIYFSFKEGAYKRLNRLASVERAGEGWTGWRRLNGLASVEQAGEGWTGWRALNRLANIEQAGQHWTGWRRLNGLATRLNRLASIE